MNTKNLTWTLLSPILVGGMLFGAAATVSVAQAGSYHAGDYGDYYVTKNGEYAVRAVNGGYEWEASNGDGGRTKTKKEAKKAAKESLEENPTT